MVAGQGSEGARSQAREVGLREDVRSPGSIDLANK